MLPVSRGQFLGIGKEGPLLGLFHCPGLSLPGSLLSELGLFTQLGEWQPMGTRLNTKGEWRGQGGAVCWPVMGHDSSPQWHLQWQLPDRCELLGAELRAHGRCLRCHSRMLGTA